MNEETTMADPTRWELDEGDEITTMLYALKRLGGGSEYEAYLAWDDRLFSLVVAKILRPHLVEEPGSLGALKREAHFLMSLNHPVIVRGFGAAVEGPRPHVVMEHLEGPNLASLIKRFGPVSLEQLLPLAVQIASGVHYLGTAEVVHLDIKPRNIIMGAPPRLIDLSVARRFARARRITGHVGTDAYMPPEQCDPSVGTIGPKSDVWGLGATLFHAVAGRVPFPRPHYDKETHKGDLPVRFPQLHRRPDDLPKETPPPLREAIEACLAFKADDRPEVRDVVALIEPMIAALPSKPVLRGLRRPRQRR